MKTSLYIPTPEQSAQIRSLISKGYKQDKRRSAITSSTILIKEDEGMYLFNEHETMFFEALQALSTPVENA